MARKLDFTGKETIGVTGLPNNWRTSLDDLAEFFSEKAESDGDFVSKEDFENHEKAKNNPHDVTKEQVGLSEVDNTSDLNKPVSILQKNALDKKVDLEGLHKTINGLPPTTHTGEVVDMFELDFGEHLIRSDLVLNAPPNTKATRAQVIKTHDEVGTGQGQLLPVEAFEQGSVAETRAVGTDYESAKYPDREPLHGARIRTKDAVKITEFSTITIKDGFEYCVLHFDKEKKYLGRSSFLKWESIPRLTYPQAEYVGIAIKKVGDGHPLITPDEAKEAGLVVSTLGQVTGGSRQILAWGVYAGDLHTITNHAGAWGQWKQINTPLPMDANEGDHLVFRSNKWVAEAPEGTITPQPTDDIIGQ